jgi:DNA-directed RNA polymerase I, II, and III subunit RPABC2
MEFEKEDFDNLSETMSESSTDEKPEKYVDSDDENNSDIEEDVDAEELDVEEGDGDGEGENAVPGFGLNGVTENMSDNSEDEDDEDDDDEIFDKIDRSRQENIIQNHHPELKTLNYEEIESLCVVVRDNKGIIIDPLHKTLPILSRYEKARILGERADQINSGAQPFIEVEPSMIDGYLIAMKELDQKKIPFIIQRPLPNGGCEYWRINDLEIIS